MKRMKKWITWLLVLLLLLSGCAQTPKGETPSEEETYAPLLYKVTDEATGNAIWLFGSIHVGVEDFYPLPEYVNDAFEQADALAVEADVVAFEKDMAQQFAAIKKVISRDGKKISEKIPKELFDQSVKIIQDAGYYNSMLEFYMPVLWSNFISTILCEKLGYDAQLGIDVHFINRAKDSGMEVREVESAEFQYGMMGSFSDELQLLLLESAVEEFEDPESEEYIREMIAVWKSGDEENLARLLNEESELDSPEEEALYEEYHNAMIVSRNRDMTVYAENALKHGDELFICVGAAHIVGEGAMAKNLQELGYRVELIK